MIKMFSVKKVCAVMLALIMALALPMTSYASSNSVTITSSAFEILTKREVNLYGYKYYKECKASTYMAGQLYWISGLKAKFSGITGGKYRGSLAADKITHTDYVSVSGVGTTTVTGGYKSLTSGFAYASSTASYEYTASNCKYIKNAVSYVASKGATISCTVSSATKYTWGNINLRTVSGDESE